MFQKSSIMFKKEGFEGVFTNQLAVGMPDDKRNNFGVSFAFEYTKMIEVKLDIFHRFKKLFELFNIYKYSNVHTIHIIHSTVPRIIVVGLLITVIQKL